MLKNKKIKEIMCSEAYNCTYYLYMNVAKMLEQIKNVSNPVTITSDIYGKMEYIIYNKTEKTFCTNVLEQMDINRMVEDVEVYKVIYKFFKSF